MPTYMKADYLNLPANLLFDRLHLYAQFHTLYIDLLTLSYSKHQAHLERKIPIDVQLKIPSERAQFSLVLELRIVNLAPQPMKVTVNLETLKDKGNKYYYVFRTYLGTVTLLVTFIQEQYVSRWVDEEEVREKRTEAATYKYQKENVGQYGENGEDIYKVGKAKYLLEKVKKPGKSSSSPFIINSHSKYHTPNRI